LAVATLAAGGIVGGSLFVSLPVASTPVAVVAGNIVGCALLDCAPTVPFAVAFIASCARFFCAPLSVVFAVAGIA